MKPETRSADELVNILEADPDRLNEVKQDPLSVLKKIRDEAKENVPSVYFRTDKRIMQVIVVVLGSVLLIATGGYIILSRTGNGEIPEALVSLGSAAIGALAGFLTQPKREEPA